MGGKNLGEAPDFMKCVVERSGRGTDDIRFAKIAFHTSLFQRAKQFFRMLMDKNRELAPALSRFFRCNDGK